MTEWSGPIWVISGFWSGGRMVNATRGQSGTGEFRSVGVDAVAEIAGMKPAVHWRLFGCWASSCSLSPPDATHCR